MQQGHPGADSPFEVGERNEEVGQVAGAHPQHVELDAFAVEQVQHSHLTGFVGRLGGVERLLTLRNEHGVEQGELFPDGFDPDQGLLHGVLHGVLGFFEPPPIRGDPVPGLLDAGAVAVLPDRQRYPHRQTQRVLAVIPGGTRPEDVRGVAAEDVHQGQTRGETGLEVQSRQLDRLFARGDERRRREQLLPVLLSQPEKASPVELHVGQFGRRDFGDGRFRGPAAERVEADGQRPALTFEVPLPIAHPGQLGLEPNDGLLEALAGGVARPAPASRSGRAGNVLRRRAGARRPGRRGRRRCV